MSVLHKPLLEYLLERLSLLKNIPTMIATTTNSTDDVIADYCLQRDTVCFRGSEQNVLERYYLAATDIQADPIIRITSDCPLMDPNVILDCLKLYGHEQKYDYATNCLTRTYPRGLDVEIFSYKALSEAHFNAKLDAEREHVTPYIRTHTEPQRMANLALMDKDLSDYRLTVDTAEDFELIRRILEELHPNILNFVLADVEKILREHPAWLKINQHVQQKV